MKTDGDAHKYSKGDLKQVIAKLNERNKELNCLFAISSIIEEQNHSMKRALQEVVKTLPPAWRYPENTCAQIILDDQVFRTDNYVETPWRQTCNLLVKGSTAGSVTICLLDNGIETTGAQFLKEETALLKAVAERLGKMIERYQTETALQKSNQRFRNLVENSITGISIVRDNKIIYQNKVQERLLGPLPRTHVLGDLSHIHPGDVEKVMQANHDIKAGKAPVHDLDFRLFPVSGDGDKRGLKRVSCRMMNVDYHGRGSILVNIIDMTQTMELEKLLFRQDKMASLGRVAAGIAHEIRNPLSGINIYLNAMEKLIDKPDSRPKVVQVIDQLQSASRRIESVIKKVMDFAKPGEPKFVCIQINKPVEDALNLTAVTMRKSDITIEKDFADKMPDCYADPHLIEAAVLNLINNAAEAIRMKESDKKIAVETGVTGGHIFIKISDTGPGVPAEYRNKVFEPFFTTKNDGTGIGLSLCQRIVTDHNGDLTIDNGILGGAEFRIEIPIRKDILLND